MKKVAIIPMVVGVAMGAAAIKLGLDFVQKAQASNGEQVTAVVAAVDIPATSEIDDTMVKTIKTPVSPLLGKDSYADVKKVVGRVAFASIPRGAVVREGLLAPKGTPPGLTVRIPAGFRAVSVKINEVSGVAYQLHPGAYVDVIAVIDIRDPTTRRKETFSRIILQQVQVVAVGRTLTAEDQPSGKGKAAKSVTLLVKDSDVPKLHLAQTRGTVTLAMRGPGDTLVADEGHATESELFGLGKEQAPAPKPKPARKAMAMPSFAARFAKPAPKQHVVTVVNGSDAPVAVTFAGPNSMQITNTRMLGKPSGAGRMTDRSSGAKNGVPKFDFDSVMERAAAAREEEQPPRAVPSPG